jgi:hypothetical protein
MSKAQFLSYLGLVKRPVKTSATLASELYCDFRLKKVSFLQGGQTHIFRCGKSGQIRLRKKKNSL